MQTPVKPKRTFYACLNCALFAIVLPVVAFTIVLMLMSIYEWLHEFMHNPIAYYPTNIAIINAILTPFGLSVVAIAILAIFAAIFMGVASHRERKRTSNLPAIVEDNSKLPECVNATAKNFLLLQGSHMLAPIKDDIIGEELSTSNLSLSVLPPYQKNDFVLEYGDKLPLSQVGNGYDPLPKAVGSIKKQKELETQFASHVDADYELSYGYISASAISTTC